MKIPLIILTVLLTCVSTLAQGPYWPTSPASWTKLGNVWTTNLATIGVTESNLYYPGGMVIDHQTFPLITIEITVGGGGTHPLSGSSASILLNYDGLDIYGGWWDDFTYVPINLSGNVHVLGNIVASGNVTAANNILWQTNIVWATNSIVATNTPDGKPIPWKAGTNVWTGTNTYYAPTVFTNTVFIKSNIVVLGTTGGTSNVPIGGMTFHFVDGFFTGATVP